LPVETPTKVIVDPSVLFTDDVLRWLADEELRPWLFVSEALWQRLEDPEGGEQFLPYGANPDPDRIRRIREAFAERRFSYREAPNVSDAARGICETLISNEEPLADVLADEWAFVTSQSLAVLAEKSQEALDAFRRAGGHVFEISDREMKRGLGKLRSRLPPRLLKVMKRVGGWPRRKVPKWIVAGGEFALALLPHVAVPLGAAELIRQGIGVIAGDP
jgi:hypothetical protein